MTDEIGGDRRIKYHTLIPADDKLVINNERQVEPIAQNLHGSINNETIWKEVLWQQKLAVYHLTKMEIVYLSFTEKSKEETQLTDSEINMASTVIIHFDVG